MPGVIVRSALPPPPCNTMLVPVCDAIELISVKSLPIFVVVNENAPAPSVVNI